MRTVLAVLAAAVLSVGCSSAADDLRDLLGIGDDAPGEDTAVGAGTDGPSADDWDEELECERDGFPCTWGEVDPDHLDVSADLADELTALTEDTWDPEVIADHLGDRADVVDAVVGTTSVRFRLEGARPMWVLAEDTYLQDEEALAADLTSSPGGVVDATPAASRAPDDAGDAGDDGPVAPTPVGVVGDDPAAKSALLLSVYDHQPLFWGTDEVADLLAGTRGYEDGVEVLRNAARDDRDVLQAYGAAYADHPGVTLARSGNRVLPVIDGGWLATPGSSTPEDLGPDGELTLEATTTLPEGGTSQHVVDIVVPDLALHLDVALEIDIPTGFQEQVGITGAVPLSAGDDPGTWSGGPVIPCAGHDVEVHLSGEEAIFTSLLIAEGVVPGPNVGNMPPELDMVEPGWVRLELEATGEPGSYAYVAGDVASTSEWDMTSEVELRLEPGDGG